MRIDEATIVIEKGETLEIESSVMAYLLSHNPGSSGKRRTLVLNGELKILGLNQNVVSTSGAGSVYIWANEIVFGDKSNE